MKKILNQARIILIFVTLTISMIIINSACERKVTSENSVSKPDPTGSQADTNKDYINPEINPEGAKENRQSGKISGSTSGNNTGRTE